MSEIQVSLSIWLGEAIFKIIEYSVSNFDLRVGAMNAANLRKEKPKLLNSTEIPNQGNCNSICVAALSPWRQET